MRLTLPALAAVSLLWACGGRDELYVDDPPPAMSSSSTGGFGGSGGAGGSPVPQGGCNSLALDGGIASPADGISADARQGALSFADVGEQTVALVASYQPLPPSGARQLRHTAFDPWDAWPQDGTLAPGYLIDDTGIVNFAVALGVEGRFAVSFIHAPPAGVGLEAHIDYLAYSPQPSVLQGVVAPNATQLLDSGHGTSLFVQPQGSGEQQLYVVTPYQADNGFQWGGPRVVGCTLGTPIVATAGTHDGALVAASQGSAIAESCFAVDASAPHGISTGRAAYYSGTNKTQVGTNFPDEDPVAMRMVPDGNGGGWLFWQPAEDLSLLRVVRIGQDAKLIGEIISLSAGLGRWDAAVAAGTLWVASIRFSGVLAVQRYDTKGVLLASGEIPIGAPSDDPPSLLVAKDGEHAVIAFGEQGETAESVRIARIGCVP